MDRYATKALQIKTAIKHKTVIPHLTQQAISFRTPPARLIRNVITEVNRAKLGHAAELYLRGRLDRIRHGHQQRVVLQKSPVF